MKIEGGPIIRYTRWSLWRLPRWLTHKRIRLQFANEYFTDATEQEMFARIKHLAELGYQVPKYLLEEAT